MRIIVAIDHFKEGGAERVASIIINRLCMEHEVHVVIMEEGINYPLDFNHIKIHIIGYNPKNKVIKVWTKLSIYRRIIREVNADVIFSFANIMSIYTVAALKGNGRKNARLIVSERTDPTREPANPVSRSLRNWAYGESDFLVCQTPWVAEYFNKYIDTKCVVIPNPITPNLPLWTGKNSKMIITACRFAEQKNIPMLINAFVRLYNLYPDMKLTIYGDGELRPYFEALVKKKGLTEAILMPGFTKNIHEAMSNNYMYVSSSDYEGISNSMLEALGVGMPTVCTDCPVGGANMFIENEENGLLVPVGDETALFEAMKRMAEDRDFALKCSRSSRIINDTIRVDNIVKQWIALIR